MAELIHWSLNALARELDRDRRSLGRQLADLEPDVIEKVSGRASPRWRLARVVRHLYTDLESDFDLRAERAKLTRARRLEVEERTNARVSTSDEIEWQFQFLRAVAIYMVLRGQCIAGWLQGEYAMSECPKHLSWQVWSVRLVSKLSTANSAEMVRELNELARAAKAAGVRLSDYSKMQEWLSKQAAYRELDYPVESDPSGVAAEDEL